MSSRDTACTDLFVLSLLLCSKLLLLRLLLPLGDDSLHITVCLSLKVLNALQAFHFSRDEIL